jgi:uncharacterized protein
MAAEGTSHSSGPSDDAVRAQRPGLGAVATRVWRPVTVGVAAGALSGLFGVGGGILIVPGLLLLVHLAPRSAYGTSLAAVLPISVASLVGYWSAGKVDWIVALVLSVGSVAGAVVGTKLLRVLPQRAIAIGFIVLLLATAARLFTDQGTASGRADLDLVMVVSLVVTGVLTGILAGLLGVGGGVVMIPVMVLAFGIPPAIAKGTSVAVIIPTSVMGTWRNKRGGNTDLGIAALVGGAGVVSAYLMSQVSVGLDARLSNVLFAVLLAVVGLRMVFDVVSELSRERRSTRGQ